MLQFRRIERTRRMLHPPHPSPRRRPSPSRPLPRRRRPVRHHHHLRVVHGLADPPAIAEAFRGPTRAFSYTSRVPGTGDGFKTFCVGETDITDASRAIKAGEARPTSCAANGIEYVELQVALDGLTVMTSPDNSAIECLTFADLYALIGPESTGFEKWSDAQALATELGSNTTFPDAPLT